MVVGPWNGSSPGNLKTHGHLEPSPTDLLYAIRQGLASTIPLQTALFGAPRIKERVQHFLEGVRPDVILVDMIRLSATLPDDCTVRAILDMEDVLSRRYLNDPTVGLGPGAPWWLRGGASQFSRQLHRIEGRRLICYESLAVSKFGNTSLVSREDASDLRRRAAEGIAKRIVWLPPKVRGNPQALSEGSRTRFILLGNYQVPHTKAAATRFAKAWLHLRDTTPSTPNLVLVGIGSEGVAAKFGVEGLGYVKDVSRVLTDKDILIVPNDTHSGVNIKLIDGLGWGALIMATPSAVRTLGVTPDGCPFCAQSAVPEDVLTSAVELAFSIQRQTSVREALLAVRQLLRRERDGALDELRM